MHRYVKIPAARDPSPHRRATLRGRGAAADPVGVPRQRAHPAPDDRRDLRLALQLRPAAATRACSTATTMATCASFRAARSSARSSTCRPTTGWRWSSIPAARGPTCGPARSACSTSTTSCTGVNGVVRAGPAAAGLAEVQLLRRPLGLGAMAQAEHRAQRGRVLRGQGGDGVQQESADARAARRGVRVQPVPPPQRRQPGPAPVVVVLAVLARWR